jgi:hypothetical protein
MSWKDYFGKKDVDAQAKATRPSGDWEKTSGQTKASPTLDRATAHQEQSKTPLPGSGEQRKALAPEREANTPRGPAPDQLPAGAQSEIASARDLYRQGTQPQAPAPSQGPAPQAGGGGGANEALLQRATNQQRTQAAKSPTDHSAGRTALQGAAAPSQETASLAPARTPSPTPTPPPRGPSRGR